MVEINDPNFPKITYHQGASGQPVAVIAGTGIRVQTIVVCQRQVLRDQPKPGTPWSGKAWRFAIAL